ncbi:27-O-demethylrifamycin SV methyltransferase [Actinopolyspora biskrensis]|uniref:27-O-demethylrifamycin SV methyltransferase n=1 Tax=Actinopolyspora biskrensis TaxID=1470178 RepID=A0A852YT48_9ACTN|nr:methyltransferase domain-containing protein [Actinopolyspora biskrensis]NYH77280.1 27-O-demethylrifamycin SV methyltransferase [Actinopolyspora biskrensis]
MYDDHTDPFARVWGANLHFGYWESGVADAPIAEATERMTDELLARMSCSPGEHVLDVGCGVGVPALRLARTRHVRVTGISTSAPQVAQASARAEEAGLSDEVVFHCGDAMELDFTDDAFDAAWALESLHHMSDRVRALRELRRVVRPGGSLAVADFILTGPVHGPDRHTVEAFREGGGAHSLGTIEDYVADLRQAGLDVIEALDVSTQARPSLTKHAEVFRDERHRLVPTMGEREVDRMIRTLERLDEMPQAGYVLLSAQVP